MTKSLVYDLEIIRAIQSRGAPRVERIEYCDGWEDHEHMGISVLAAYDYAEDRYRVFCEDNLGEFADLASQRFPLVGYNNITFDNRVIAASHFGTISPDSCYDLLVELWKADGLGPDFQYQSHTGYSLDDGARVNLGAEKSGHGALAPVAWQQGKIGAVIDYCLNDVRLTKGLYDMVLAGTPLVIPKSGRTVRLLQSQGAVANHQHGRVQGTVAGLRAIGQG